MRSFLGSLPKFARRELQGPIGDDRPSKFAWSELRAGGRALQCARGDLSVDHLAGEGEREGNRLVPFGAVELDVQLARCWYGEAAELRELRCGGIEADEDEVEGDDNPLATWNTIHGAVLDDKSLPQDVANLVRPITSRYALTVKAIEETVNTGKALAKLVNVTMPSSDGARSLSTDEPLSRRRGFNSRSCIIQWKCH